jgi:hypothetical protein
MKDVSADKAKKTAQMANDEARFAVERTPLDRRYGKIGISAVAAAARYQGAAKNPAYAPVAMNWYDRAEEAA